MRVLVSNDDGVDAPGIHALAQGLREAGHEVYVVAPDRDRSGASNSLTLDLPISAGVRAVLHGEVTPAEGLKMLMAREQKAEYPEVLFP